LIKTDDTLRQIGRRSKQRADRVAPVACIKRCPDSPRHNPAATRARSGTDVGKVANLHGQAIDACDAVLGTVEVDVKALTIKNRAGANFDFILGGYD
jgi:hypothetical protein